MSRLLYAVNHLQLNHTDQPLFNVTGFDPGKFGYFDGCYDQIHVDEKWFFVTQEKQKIYLTEGEVGPTRTTQHKSHIEKVMFLSAVARPRFDAESNCVFDGKIGIWPFVTRSPAQQSSVNRPRGAMVTMCQNVTVAVYLEMITDKVIQAI